jgi:Xaa-Pro aminopeptidase
MIAARRARALAAMHDADVDALIVGREANARYVSGARRLWLAGARAFAPGCVLVRSTGDVHLLSTSDDLVPDDIPLDHLYPITWNPTNLMTRLAQIPGLRAARRIGVDSLTPMTATLLTRTFADAELVDGQAVMLSARREKLPDEVDAIRRAIVLATEALDTLTDEVQPGARERDLLGRFEQHMCERGTTTPAFEGAFGHVFPSDRALVAGDLVVLDVGVLLDGYEGGLARTVVCGESAAAAAPADELFDALRAAVRPGATGADLWAAWDATGAPRPDAPVAHGVGIGFEPPVVGNDVSALTAGTTLSLRAEVDGWVRRDIVLITDDGTELLGA